MIHLYKKESWHLSQLFKFDHNTTHIIIYRNYKHLKIKYLNFFLHFFRFWNIMKYKILYKIKTMNKFIKKLLRKFKKFRENHNSNMNILIECIAIIMIWRGVWDLLEIYVIPENQLASNIICIIIWIIVLLWDDWRLWELEEEPHRNKNR